MLNLDGTNDAAIVKSSNRIVVNRKSIEVFFVVGHSQVDFPTNDQQAHAASKHIAASYHNPNHPVLTVLTDLQNSWTIYYFAAKRSTVHKVGLFRLPITSWWDARRFFGQMYMHQDFVSEYTFPSVFRDRLSYNDALSVVNRNTKKRVRSNSPNLSNHNVPARKRLKACGFEGSTSGGMS